MMRVNQSWDIASKSTPRTVLVVEDNEINREMLSALLEDEFTVLEAENGAEGLKQLEEHYKELSLILLDVYMPVCDGFEFLEKKGEDSRFDTVPVIVTTASGSLEDEIRCLELGANDFVVKPYNFEIMMNRIHNMIRLRESASIVNQLTWDSVTNLYSKVFFFRAIEKVTSAAPSGTYDLVVSGIEHFEALVDRYGEARCDLLLHELATRLVAVLPGIVAGGRLTDNTFGFLLENKVENWEELLAPVTVRLPLPNLSVKYGVVEGVEANMKAAQLCHRATSACKTVRGKRGVSVGMFDDKLHERHVMEQTIRDSAETALAEHQFSVFFQPKHDVRSNKTGGAEALVRWTHPELGFISPGDFIPIFERSGFITDLDLYVWEEVCQELRRCIDSGLPVVPISVNASRLDFDVRGLTQTLAELADRYDIDHSLLHVEITETAYSENPDAVINTLRKLRALGFATELDDFGAGYSSLASLNILPLDIMKLDMSLVRQATLLNDFRIVESMITLAQLLDLRTVVEGVETEEQARHLTEIGCDYIQGFFFSKPLPRDEFEDYLARS